MHAWLPPVSDGPWKEADRHAAGSMQMRMHRGSGGLVWLPVTTDHQCNASMEMAAWLPITVYILLYMHRWERVGGVGAAKRLSPQASATKAADAHARTRHVCFVTAGRLADKDTTRLVRAVLAACSLPWCDRWMQLWPAPTQSSCYQQHCCSCVMLKLNGLVQFQLTEEGVSWMTRPQVFRANGHNSVFDV